jgi:hypothetical protein
VIQTCQQRGRSVWDFLKDAVGRSFNGEPLAVLLESGGSAQAEPVAGDSS